MIGKIASIKDFKIYVSLTINIYNIDNLIGKHIVFNNRYIGEINNASSTLLEVFLIGEIVNNAFLPGSSSMPPFGSSVRLINKNELDLMYGINATDNYVKVGQSLTYNNYNVFLNVNTFFANHFAIYGNSGSGKSYFVTRLLQGIFYDSKTVPFNSNIFLFDAYGEYQQAFNKINQVNSNLNYRVITTNFMDNQYEKLFIPFWFLGVDDLCLLLNVDDLRQIPIIEKALKLVFYFSQDENKVLSQKNDIIARSILDVIYSGNGCNEIRNKITTILTKFNTKDINLDITLTKGGWTRSIRQCIYVNETGKFADIEIVISYLEQFCSEEFELTMPDGSYMYSINDFYNSLEFALISEGVFSNNKVFDYANILKIRLNSLINSVYANYFECNRYMNRTDYIKYLLYGNNKKYQIINFNINSIDDRFAKVIVKIYSKILFDFITNLPNRGTMPIHLILEEAHRYIQNDIDKKILGYNIFERIAKEGRKYGILLGVISQRPSEMSETVISQCSNFAIFKMFYQEDINFVLSVLPKIEEDMIEKIKMLSPGSCMLLGNAFKIPLLTMLDMPNPKPYSDSCNINKTWYVN